MCVCVGGGGGGKGGDRGKEGGRGGGGGRTSKPHSVATAVATCEV